MSLPWSHKTTGLDLYFSVEPPSGFNESFVLSQAGVVITAVADISLVSKPTAPTEV